MPTIMASIVATRPAMSATTIVARAPTKSWERMSWPRLVVPSQWLIDGVRFGTKLVALGLYGAIHGPITVKRTKKPTIPRPTFTLGDLGIRTTLIPSTRLAFAD